MRKRKLLITCLLSLIGALQMTAQTTLTEDFNSVTIQKDGADISGWQTGNGLSNGWYIIGASAGIYTDDQYGANYYGLVSDDNGGKCIGYDYGTSNAAYLAIPDKLTGEVSFSARATTTNSRYQSYIQVSLYEVNDDNTIGNLIGTVKPTSTSWGSYTIDLGTEGKQVAIFLVRARIDNISATIYEDGAEVKAIGVDGFSAEQATVNATAAGDYTANFTVLVQNKGNADLTAADGATVSLLDASKNVVATSEPIVLAQGESKAVTITYNGHVTADGEVTFYVKEDLTDKQYATPVTITVQLAGARFAINASGLQDFGFVSEGVSVVKVYTVTNSGNAPLTVDATTPSGFESSAPLTVEAGGTGELSISLEAADPGIHSGNVAITTNAVDVKSLTLPVSAYVYPIDVEHLDFTELPANWTAKGFTVADGLATAGYGTNTLTSPAILFNDGHVLAIKARFDSSMGEIVVKGSADMGDTWTAFEKTYTAESGEFGTDGFTTVEVKGIPATVNMLQISGQRFAITDMAGFNYNDNAPKMAVTKDGAAVTEDDFGTLTASSSHTYTVANTGTGTLRVAIASDSDDFTVSPATLEVAGGEEATFTVTFTFSEESYGEKSGNVTVTPQNEGLSPVTFAVKAFTKDPNVWDEDFEGGAMPAYWTSEGVWTVTQPTYTGNNGTYMAYIRSYGAPKALTTPRLQAKAGDVLTFYVGMEYDDEPMIIEYSADERETWTVIQEAVTESGELSFTAPVDGYYYLRFTATFAMLDNFLGFKLALKEHDMAITASTIPATGKQYEAYTASVSLQELVGKDETATATLYVDGTPMAEADATVEANGTKAITLEYTPATAGTLPVYIEVSYEGGTLKTDVVDVTFEPAFTLSENGGNTIAEGNYDIVNVEYTIASQWNTICLPFKVSDLSLLGEGTEAYELSGFSGGLLQFSPVTELQAGYPYLLKVQALPDQLLFNKVVIYSFTTAAQSETKDGVTFFGSYEPVAAPGMQGMYGVTDAGTIRRGGSGANLLGLRGYFQLPSDASAEEYGIMIGGETVTAIRGIDAPALAGDVYDLSGRKMSGTQSLQPGIYVVNGKKIVVK